MSLGRGRSTLVFNEYTVVKHYAPVAEPIQMLMHPLAFIAVLDVDPTPGHTACHTAYVMPRLHDPGSDKWALIEASRKLGHIWSQNREFLSWRNWREQLTTHLDQIGCPDNVVLKLVGRLKEPTRNCHIHGDPTFANLVRSGRSGPFWWLDPLVRTFIPGDPHVDLGKLFQSCWGYERCLVDPKFTPTFDKTLAVQLADSLQLDYDQGWAWCAVHIARLLRYQEPHVAQAFGRVLCDMSST